MPGSLFVPLFVAAALASSPAGQLGDDALLGKATSAVEASPHFTIFDDVQVEVSGEVIALKGKVTSHEKKRALEGAVAGAVTPRAIVNHLHVLRASPSDRALRDRLARTIYGNPAFWQYSVMPNPPIHILVEDAHVTLTGAVRTDADRALARALATQSGAVAVDVLLVTDTERERSADAR